MDIFVVYEYFRPQTVQPIQCYWVRLFVSCIISIKLNTTCPGDCLPDYQKRKWRGSLEHKIGAGRRPIKVSQSAIYDGFYGKNFSCVID